MINTSLFTRKLLPIFLILCNSSFLFAEEKMKEKQSHNIMAKGMYARETEDTDWQIKITGEVPSLCGAYILLHDINGKIIHKGQIPHGKYSSEKPFTMDVKKDGIKGDYKIIIIGQQEDMLGINVPLTTLPYEVYGGESFALGRDEKADPAFKVEKEKEITIAGYKGHLRLKNEKGKTLIDTAEGGKNAGSAGLGRHKAFRYCNYVKFKAVPGKTYVVDDYKTFYFKFSPAVYMTFDPDRWFDPDKKLDEVKWWREVIDNEK